MPRSLRFRFPTVVGAIAVVALALVACDDDGEDAAKREPEVSSSEARTIEIEMRDTAFSPARVEVAAGETVRFAFHNTGEAVHDAFIGDEQAQDDHEMEMAEGGMAHEDDGDDGDHGDGGEDGEDGEDGDAVTVDPGETDELVHTFEAGDDLLIGCHQPGHYGAGMKVVIAVT